MWHAILYAYLIGLIPAYLTLYRAVVVSVYPEALNINTARLMAGLLAFLLVWIYPLFIPGWLITRDLEV